MTSMRTLAALLLVLSTSATAGAQDLVLEDTGPDDAPRYFAVPFSVPAGTVEIEVRHDDLSDPSSPTSSPSDRASSRPK